MALFSKTGPPDGWSRIAFRVLIAVSIPCVIVAWLLYSAAAEEERIHARNLRWLAQMANQISDRVLNYDGMVSQALRSGQNNYSSVDGLEPEHDANVCAQWKQLTVGYEDGKPKLRFVERENDRRAACAQYDLTKLVERAIRPDVFTSIVLAQRDGTVLYQSGLDSIRMTDVSFLFVDDGEKRKPGLSDNASQPKPAADNEEGTAGKSSRKKDAPTSSIHLMKRIGDAQFAVFVQPIPLLVGREAAGPSERDWLLIGLTEKHKSLVSSSPRDLMLVIPLALLLGLLSWPLTRLWSMSPSDALMPRHLVQIVTCSMLVVTLLMMLGLSQYLRESSSLKADLQLRTLSGAISNHLKRELELALRQLKEIDLQTEFAPENQPMQKGIFERFRPDQIYIPFEYADWINSEGWKESRWTPTDKLAQRLYVGDRKYFQQVKNEETISIGGDLPNFSIERVLARTNGKVSTVISISPARKSASISAVSLLTTLTSTSDPILPRGFGFAIIDHDGTVLFHSDPTRIFVEKFFDECEESRELKEIVERRGQAFLDATYQAASQRMMISPLRGLEAMPWTLVVFRDLAPVRATRVQSLVDTIVLLLAYATIAGLVVALLCWLLPRRWFALPPVWKLAWWAKLHTGYSVIALAGFLPLLIAWLALDRLNGPGLFYVAISIAVLLIAISATPVAGLSSNSAQNAPDTSEFLDAGSARPRAGRFVLKRVWPSRSDHFRKIIAQAAWLAWIAEFALAVCIAPPFLLGKLAFEYEIGLRVRDSQLRLWRQDTARRARLQHEILQLSGIKGCPEKRQRLFDASGLNSCSPLYFYGAGGSHTVIWPRELPRKACTIPPPRLTGVAAGIPKLLMAAVEIPYDGHAMGFDMRNSELEPPAGFWTWHVDDSYVWLCSKGSVVARSQRPKFAPFSLGAGSGNADRPEAGALPVEGLLGGEAWMGLLLMIALLMVWMWKLRSRLLLADLSETEFQPVNIEVDRPESQRLFVLIRPGCDIEPLLDRWTTPQHVDCAAEKAEPEITTGGVLLYHIEARFSDDEARLATLARLEAALQSGNRPLVMLSEIDMVQYLTTGGGGTAGKPAAAAEIARWRSLMNYFETRTFDFSSADDAPDSAAIWNGCSEQERRLLVQFCNYGWINPRAMAALRGLLRRGLIQREAVAGFVLFDSRFAAFVAAQHPVTEELEQRKARTGQKRLPAYAIALVLLGLILFFAEEEITVRLIGFLTTLAAGFDTVRRQLAGTESSSGARKA